MRKNPKVEGRKVAEWCRLVGRGEVLAQVAPKVQNGRPKGGEREAARQLGLDRDDVRRAAKVGREDKVAQVGPVSLGGRGKKFRVNLTQNLRAARQIVSQKNE